MAYVEVLITEESEDGIKIIVLYMSGNVRRIWKPEGIQAD